MKYQQKINEDYFKLRNFQIMERKICENKMNQILIIKQRTKKSSIVFKINIL
ncbi:hypothetical protein pb186bvf_002460 [Paramecium bursaria]